MHTLQNSQIVDSDIDTIWEFFSTPSNLNELTPPSLRFEILSGEDERIHNGQVICYRIGILPFLRCKWLTEIKHVVPFQSFVDEQRLGPYAFWYHKHSFIKHESTVEIVDTVNYSIGFGPMGSILNFLWIKHHLNHIFSYRNERMIALFSK